MKLFQREKSAFRTQQTLVLLNALNPAHPVDAGHFKVGFLAKSTLPANR